MLRFTTFFLVLGLSGCALPAEGAIAPVEPAAPVEPTPAEERILADGPTASARLDSLAANDPIAFLEHSIARYDREVRGYRVLLIKQERINGKLGPVEEIVANFTEEPFSVRMEWKQGARLARRSLFVRGRNKDQVLVAPAGWRALAGTVERDPLGDDAKASARYPITEFGIRHGTVRTLNAWRKAREQGDFTVSFGGIKPVPELGGRLCRALRRHVNGALEADGTRNAVFYFDVANDLQIGSVLEGENGELIGKYWFRDLECNPTFASETFTREGLRK